MIYCNLKGGLGNMLFQIAATKSFAIDRDNECSFPNLKKHLEYLDSDNNHNPDLKHSMEYLKLFKNLNITPPIDGENVRVIHYPFEFIDLEFNDKNVIVDGFFQSEKYFKHNRKEILKLIDFSFIPKEYIENKYSFIKNKKTTSIHIRRGDYVNFPNIHPTQSLEYYKQSIDILKDMTDLFIVFSDDINWCKENIKLENIIYIDDEKDYIELYLMSLCDNNITANSSFSWWGAWLNETPNKIVIGPLKWFGNDIQLYTGDILPNNWIKL
jgi:hypothetical protein